VLPYISNAPSHSVDRYKRRRSAHTENTIHHAPSFPYVVAYSQHFRGSYARPPNQIFQSANCATGPITCWNTIPARQPDRGPSAAIYIQQKIEVMLLSASLPTEIKLYPKVFHIQAASDTLIDCGATILSGNSKMTAPDILARILEVFARRWGADRIHVKCRGRKRF
jgi:hypothetical protein